MYVVCRPRSGEFVKEALGEFFHFALSRPREVVYREISACVASCDQAVSSQNHYSPNGATENGTRSTRFSGRYKNSRVTLSGDQAMASPKMCIAVFNGGYDIIVSRPSPGFDLSLLFPVHTDDGLGHILATIHLISCVQCVVPTVGTLYTGEEIRAITRRLKAVRRNASRRCKRSSNLISQARF
jgi:hypothetical protein